jgi:hypothetical protein
LSSPLLSGFAIGYAKPVPTTPFGKATAATWLSECIKTDQWFYKESMTLDGVSAGVTNGEYFSDRNCTQTINRKDTVNFNYSSREVSDTRSTITIFNPKDNNKATSVLDVTLSNNGNSMRVTTQTGLTINYQRAFDQNRIGRQTGNANNGNGRAVEAFDRLAAGNWITNECQGGMNDQSYHELIRIDGNGRAVSKYDLYRKAFCQGYSTPTQEQTISYSVRNFSNNSGQVEIAGELCTVSFPSPTLMNVTNAQGRTLLYRRNF